MANDRFIRFTPKQDGVDQVISADHINTLQTAAEETQRAIFQTQDSDFLDKALFILEHHRMLNGLWADTFDDIDKLDLIKTTGVTFSDDEKAIVFPEGSTDTDGTVYSKTYVNPNGANMKKVMVIVRASIPAGSDIIVSVSNNGSDFYEVSLSDSNMFELPTDGQKLKLMARFVRSDLTASPRLDAWAIMFRDPTLNIVDMPDGSKVVIGDPSDGGEYGELINIMHNQLLGIGPDDHHPQQHRHDGIDGSGLISHSVLTDIGEDDHHAKNHQHGEDGVDPVDLTTDVIGTLATEHLSYLVWSGRPGGTGLSFDPNLGDRLVYVKTPDDETYMFYDLVNDRLSHTITIREGIAVWETMDYGTYNGSTGQNIILAGTTKTHYDATDAAIRIEIEKMTAPDKITGIVVSNPGVGGTLDVSWTAGIEHDLTGYNLLMSTDGVVWLKVNLTGLIPTNGYSVSGLTNGVTYQFRVKAVDTSGYESVDSNTVTGIPS